MKRYQAIVLATIAGTLIYYNYSIKDTVDEIQDTIEETNEIVIQVNGKKRNTISVKKDMNEKEIINQIEDEKLINKYLDSGELIKTIYVKNRLINYIIK